MRNHPVHALVFVAAAIIVANISPARAEIDLDDPSEPWLTAKVGVTADVPPPFEPLKRKGPEVTCWGRSYRLTGLFPEKITGAGKELLVGPVKVILETQGATHVLSGGKPSFGLARGDRIEWQASGSAGPIRWRSQCWIEYDGVCRIKLTLTAEEPIKVDSLRIEIPLNPAFDLFYQHSQWCRAPWWRFDNVGGKAGHKLTVPWMGYTWIGDDYRGLTFVAETMHGWTETKKTFDVIRQKDRLLMRVHVWRKAVEVKGEKTFVFGLQATPPKPLPPEWHGRHIGSYPPENLNIRYLWHSNTKWFSYPQERKPGSMTDPVKKLHKTGNRVLMYITPSGTGPESQVFQRHRDDWLLDDGRGKPLIRDGGVERTGRGLYGVCPASSYTDWMAWGVDQAMAAYDIDGIYIDNSHAYACLNKRHGCGTGNHKTYPYFANREWHKRLYAIIRKHKPKRGFVVQHHSFAFNSFSLGFADMYIHGEQFRNLKGWKLDLERDITRNRPYMRVGFTGRQWGAQASFLPSVIAVSGHQYTDWMIARTLPWGNVLFLHHYWMDSSRETPVLRARHEFGLGREEVEWFTPVDPPPKWLTIEPDHLLVGGYVRKDGETLLTLSNIQKELAIARLKVAPLEQHLGKGFRMIDALTGVPITFKTKYGVKVLVHGNSFRVLRLGRKRDKQ